jgi:hypothetical protein
LQAGLTVNNAAYNAAPVALAEKSPPKAAKPGDTAMAPARQ